MALIKCPECGKEVSDKATICIECGFPIHDYILKVNEERKLQEKKANENIKLEFKKADDEKRWEELPDKRNVLIQKKAIMIEVYGMTLKIRIPGRPTISDNIWNFTLEYFGISMGFNIGFMITNASKQYSSGVVDIIDKGKVKNQLELFKEIMENNGLYAARSRFDVLYRKTESDRSMQNATKQTYSSLFEEKETKTENFHGIYKYVSGKKVEVFCPRCNSQNCSYYTTEKVVPEKTKTRYTANLNPFRPFTLVNKKETVIRKSQTVSEQKIICNDCGNIFQ